MKKEQLKKHEQMLMNQVTFVEIVSELVKIVSELVKSAGKNDINTSEPHLPLGDVSGTVCAHDWIKKYYKDCDYAWKCIKCSEIK